MLVFSRNEQESFQIGKPGDVLTEPIVVTRLRGSKIGVDAQRDVSVKRTEVIDKPPARDVNATEAEACSD